MNIKHNLRHHRLYNVWKSMKARCTNPKNTNYKSYGGRGITVCDKWLDINNFIDDMYPSFVEGLTLDRKENDKGYSKDNCRWATKIVQSRNTRRIRSNNTSGYRGVSWCASKNKWVSQITVNFLVIFIGRFNTSLESALAYDKYIANNNLEHTKNFT